MDKELYKKFSEVEEKLWWFKARKNIIEELIKEIACKFDNPKILDFGAGLGILSNMMSQCGDVIAIDNSNEVVKYNRFPIKISENLNDFENEKFDIVTSFDVLEHCSDDLSVLKEFNRVLIPGGVIFVTVPAHQFLWSYHDVFSHHFRRYSKVDLINKFKIAGFKIDRVSFFCSFLFPLFVFNILLNRLFFIITKNSKDTVRMPNGVLNRFLFFIFNLEKFWLKKGNFFNGSSLLLIAKK